MRLKLALLGVAGLAGGFSLLPSYAASSKPLTVVELFQSEGCSSCPPAEAILNRIAGRPDILALSFEVTYWDQLGWKDRYSQQAFTDRQYDYARTAGTREVFTPQMVINGKQSIIGSRSADVEAALAHPNASATAPSVTIANNMASVSGSASARDAQIWLVTYDPRTINVAVRSGENAGRTLPHRNVVIGLKILGAWRGGQARFTLPAAQPNTAHAVLVQLGTGGPILAAAKTG